MFLLRKNWISEEDAKARYELSALDFRLIVSAGFVASRDRGALNIWRLKETLYLKSDLEAGKRTYKERGALEIAKSAIAAELQVQVPRRVGQLFLATVGLAAYSMRETINLDSSISIEDLEREFPSGQAKILGLQKFMDDSGIDAAYLAEAVSVHKDAVVWAAEELTISSGSALKIWKYTSNSLGSGSFVRIVPAG